MLPFVMVLLFPILGALFVGYLALRLVRAFERRSTGVGEMAELLTRVEQLENALEQQGSELRQVADRQSFAEQLQAGRRPDANASAR